MFRPPIVPAFTVAPELAYVQPYPAPGEKRFFSGGWVRRHVGYPWALGFRVNRKFTQIKGAWNEALRVAWSREFPRACNMADVERFEVRKHRLFSRYVSFRATDKMKITLSICYYNLQNLTQVIDIPVCSSTRMTTLLFRCKIQSKITACSHCCVFANNLQQQ